MRRPFRFLERPGGVQEISISAPTPPSGEFPLSFFFRVLAWVVPPSCAVFFACFPPLTRDGALCDNEILPVRRLVSGILKTFSTENMLCRKSGYHSGCSTQNFTWPGVRFGAWCCRICAVLRSNCWWFSMENGRLGRGSIPLRDLFLCRNLQQEGGTDRMPGELQVDLK